MDSKNHKGRVIIRSFQLQDFEQIHKLNHTEGWNNLVERHQDIKAAWENSNIAFVACIDNQIVGYIRGLTDQFISTYVCELLVDPNFRGLGIGTKLLKHVQLLYPKTRIDLLANKNSSSFYKEKGFREFYGFRKNIEE